MSETKIADKYLIIKEIGRGGMGVVYLARHLELDREVAVKALHPHSHSGEEYVARFRREARAMAKLKHNGILQVYDIVQEQGVYYIVMEYFDAQSLKELIADRGPVSIYQSLVYLKEIATALDYAHKKNVFHRDVKPGNILIGSDGSAKIGDFGVATMEDESQLTRTGQLIGTPRYMSPEQAAGNPVDARSDLYSLGAVFYEMTTRQVLFDGDSSIAIIGKLVYQTNELELSFPNNFPAPIRKLILALLRRDPKARIQSAQQLISAIDNLLPLFANSKSSQSADADQDDSDATDTLTLSDHGIYEPIHLPAKPVPAYTKWGLAGGLALVIAVVLGYLVVGDFPPDKNQTTGQDIASESSGSESLDRPADMKQIEQTDETDESGGSQTDSTTALLDDSSLDLQSPQHAETTDPAELEQDDPASSQDTQPSAGSQTQPPENDVATAADEEGPSTQPADSVLIAKVESEQAKLMDGWEEINRAYERAKRKGAARKAAKQFRQAGLAKSTYAKHMDQILALSDGGEYERALVRSKDLNQQVAGIVSRYEKSIETARVSDDIAAIDKLRTSLLSANQRADGSKQLADENGAAELKNDIYAQGENQHRLAMEAVTEARRHVVEEHYKPAQLAFKTAIDHLNQAEKNYLQAYESARRQAAEAKPAAPPTGKPSAKDISAVENLLSEFKRHYEQKNLDKIRDLSATSDANLQELDDIFQHFKQVEVTIEGYSVNPQTATADLVIKRLVQENGDEVIPSKKWRRSRLTIQKQENQWGKIQW